VKKLSTLTEDGSLPKPVAERRLIVDRTRKLGSTEIRNMFAFLEASEFWDRPYIDPYRDKIGTDGSEWIFEGVDGGRHHFTRRWSPLPNRVLGAASPPADYVTEHGEVATPLADSSRHKSIQEAGLDSLCLYILLLGGASTEEIY